MRIEERLTLAWNQLNLGRDAERDPGFRRIILRRTRGGMTVAATLAIVSVLLFVLSYLIRGRTLSFTAGSGNSVVLWDELLVLIVSGLVFAFAQTRIGQGHGRGVIAVMTILISLAILIEDAGNKDFSFTPGYLSLVLLVSVGTMPFRPAQTLALGATVTALFYVFTARFAPAFYDIHDGSDTSLTVYLIVLTAMLGGISGLLYYSRYQQYQALKSLARTQAQLIQSEKMASLGQLTAGIAHEIKNPLNFINNFAELNLDHVAELGKVLDAHRDEIGLGLRQSIRESLDFLFLNAGKIREQGQRVDAIVRAMMLHARGKPGERRATALNSFVDEYVNLAFYGIRVSRPGSLITIRRDYDDRVGNVEIVPQDLARVIINLLNNAFDAVHDRALQLNGQNEGDGERYEPVVAIGTQRQPNEVIIRISDNGTGIPPEIRQKIFDPFFTTKPAGQGTGLGLSMSYDIVVNGHGGKIEAVNAHGGGAEFVIHLPAVPLRYAVPS